MQHTSYCTKYDEIESFGYTVVLRCVRWCDLSLYPLTPQIGGEHTRGVLSPTVCAKSRDLLASGLLRPCLVDLEVAQHFVPSLHSIHHDIAAVVVNEGNQISGLLVEGGNAYGTANIGVHKLQAASHPLCSSLPWHCSPMRFADDARLT